MPKVSFEPDVLRLGPFRSSGALKSNTGYFVGHAGAEIAFVKANESCLSVKVDLQALKYGQGQTILKEECVSPLSAQKCEIAQKQIQRMLEVMVDPTLLPITSDAKQDTAGVNYTWVITVNVACLSPDNSVFDHLSLCAIFVLVQMQLPTLTWDEKRKWWVKGDTVAKRLLSGTSNVPIPVTCYLNDAGSLVCPAKDDEDTKPLALVVRTFKRSRVVATDFIFISPPTLLPKTSPELTEALTSLTDAAALEAFNCLLEALPRA